VRWAETDRAADASQAAYFRGTLADDRETAHVDLAAARDRLRDLTEGNQVLGLRGMARARSKVREFESQVRELDRLIAALDRRFSAWWSAERQDTGLRGLTVVGPNSKG
jgi:exonuclease VII small subunit